MDLHPIKTEEELANELFQLAERAKLGGLKSDNIDAIDEIINTINESSEIIPKELLPEKTGQPLTGSAVLRNSYRMSVNRDAVAILQEQRLHMKITDVSTSGFGLHSETEVPFGENIYLEINGLDGMDLFSCLICSCEPQEGGFHVGVKINRKLPRL
ncbi:MAG: PilZ domain-containing protein [Magnetococcales bacterium]|nr:PilZ domain-containing protein [Magnetococcales bacterium]